MLSSLAFRLILLASRLCWHNVHFCHSESVVSIRLFIAYSMQHHLMYIIIGGMLAFAYLHFCHPWLCPAADRRLIITCDQLESSSASFLVGVDKDRRDQSRLRALSCSFLVAILWNYSFLQISLSVYHRLPPSAQAQVPVPHTALPVL